MGWRKCEKANKCPYGSETNPGMCGYSTCRVKVHLEREYKSNYACLVRDGSLSKEKAYFRSMVSLKRKELL